MCKSVSYNETMTNYSNCMDDSGKKKSQYMKVTHIDVLC